MINHHFNHPSIMTWGSMNEIFLWGNNAARIKIQDDSVYCRNVAKLASTLDSLIHDEDPVRFSIMAIHMSGDYDKYEITVVDGKALLPCNIYRLLDVYNGSNTRIMRYHNNGA